MKQPWYQKLVESKILVFFVASLAAIGSVFDTLVNTFQLITPEITYIGTLMCIVLFGGMSLYLRSHGLAWVTKDGKTTMIRGAGIRPKVMIATFVFLLWLPMIKHVFGDPDKGSGGCKYWEIKGFVVNNEEIIHPVAKLETYSLKFRKINSLIIRVELLSEPLDCKTNLKYEWTVFDEGNIEETRSFNTEVLVYDIATTHARETVKVLILDVVSNIEESAIFYVEITP